MTIIWLFLDYFWAIFAPFGIIFDLKNYNQLFTCTWSSYGRKQKIELARVLWFYQLKKMCIGKVVFSQNNNGILCVSRNEVIKADRGSLSLLVFFRVNLSLETNQYNTTGHHKNAVYTFANWILFTPLSCIF